MVYCVSAQTWLCNISENVSVFWMGIKKDKHLLWVPPMKSLERVINMKAHTLSMICRNTLHMKRICRPTMANENSFILRQVSMKLITAVVVYFIGSWWPTNFRLCHYLNARIDNKNGHFIENQTTRTPQRREENTPSPLSEIPVRLLQPSVILDITQQ